MNTENLKLLIDESHKWNDGNGDGKYIYKEYLISEKNTDDYFIQDIYHTSEYVTSLGIVQDSYNGTRKRKQKKYICIGGPNAGSKLTSKDAGKDYKVFNNSYNYGKKQKQPNSILVYLPTALKDDPELLTLNQIPTTMTTMSGKKIDLVDPDPAQIDIFDIAWHLSLINRYNGATNQPYNVAQHSVHVYQMHSKLIEGKLTKVNPIELNQESLLHDGAEYLLGDVIRPMKYSPGFKEVYSALEYKVNRAIEKALHLHCIDKTVEVNQCDNDILIEERKLLKSKSYPGVENNIYVTEAWDWKKSYNIFIKTWFDLEEEIAIKLGCIIPFSPAD